jgi:hypothetical protein
MGDGTGEGEEDTVLKLAAIAGLLILACSMLPGCTAGESLSQPGSPPIEIQRIDVGVGGTFGPRHGPYGQ